MNKTARSLMIGTAVAVLLASCSPGPERAAESPPAVPQNKPIGQAPAQKEEVPSPPRTPVTSAEPAEAPVAKEPVKPAPEPQPTASSSVYGAVPKNPAAAVINGDSKPKEPPKSAASGDRKELSWYYMKKPKGQVPNFPAETKAFTKDMKALWVGTGKKVYLTIDTGGPLGDIDTLVKSLKDNDAKANFFIAGYNVKKNPDFIRRLVADGHLVANHTMTHTDMNLQTDDQIRKEIQDYEKLYKEVTGKEIEPYFRFPYGRYNMHILKLVSDMGYSSVFWSTAMRDWEPRKNGAEDPYNDIMNNLHDGNIILMHQGSPENIEALDRIVKAIKKAGYEFALLNDIEPPK